ncbi:hypothetical protein BX285_6298 [Streptomyces sp. 1114.5]|nr:hypothetical protein BX285_6298 [Streptomyces sp. 1114.5]
MARHSTGSTGSVNRRGLPTGAARCNTPTRPRPHNAWSDPQHGPVLHLGATPRCTPRCTSHPPPGRRAPPSGPGRREGRPSRRPPPSSSRGPAPAPCRTHPVAPRPHTGAQGYPPTSHHTTAPPATGNATAGATTRRLLPSRHQSGLHGGLTATQPSSRNGGAQQHPDRPGRRDGAAEPGAAGRPGGRPGRRPSPAAAGQAGAGEAGSRQGRRPARRPPRSTQPAPHQTEHRSPPSPRPPQFRPEITPPPSGQSAKTTRRNIRQNSPPKTAHTTEPTPRPAPPHPATTHSHQTRTIATPTHTANRSDQRSRQYGIQGQNTPTTTNRSHPTVRMSYFSPWLARAARRRASAASTRGS